MAKTNLKTAAVKDSEVCRRLTLDEYDEIHLKISFVDSVLEVFKSVDVDELNAQGALTQLAFEAAYKLEEISKILDREDSKKDN